MFATFIFLPHTRFTPIEKIMTDPISDRYSTASVVTNGETRLARSVIKNCMTNTGSTEKAEPIPIDEVIIAMIMKSKTDLSTSVE